MARSISNRRVISVDFQKAESESKPNDFRSDLLNALLVEDDHWDLEWHFIKKNITFPERIIARMIFCGYTQQEISDVFEVSQSSISQNWDKIQDKIKKMY
jgi:DNA-directed RNA polymerase specialized sigma subunit|tara:strand:+ start:409 stop:708 length:300 start_codon:yes stop_codon:yes gene_type:complete